MPALHSIHAHSSYTICQVRAAFIIQIKIPALILYLTMTKQEMKGTDDKKSYEWGTLYRPPRCKKASQVRLPFIVRKGKTGYTHMDTLVEA